MKAAWTLSSILLISAPIQNGRAEAEPEDTAAASKAPRVDVDRRARDEAVVQRAGILGMLRDSEDSAVLRVLLSHRLGPGVAAATARLKGTEQRASLETRARPAGSSKTRRSVSIGTLARSSDASVKEVRTRGKARARLGTTRTLPGIDASHVRRVLRSADEDVVACTRSELRRQPRFEGVFDTELRVGADGKVERVKVIAVDRAAPQLVACLEAAFRELRFEAPKGGGRAIVKDSLTLGRPIP
jgi:hypothetical protein